MQSNRVVRHTRLAEQDWLVGHAQCGAIERVGCGMDGWFFVVRSTRVKLGKLNAGMGRYLILKSTKGATTKASRMDAFLDYEANVMLTRVMLTWLSGALSRGHIKSKKTFKHRRSCSGASGEASVLLLVVSMTTLHTPFTNGQT